mmetsp:Transcript_17407/g.31236  ORF Transcript_17407/g.31236 Transcript_17407/m.31236 type:complete len:198 (+) Transcript_17407:699-1292(+)
MTSAKHIASIGLLLVSFALIGIGFGGSTDPKLAWGLSKLETKGNFGYVGSFDCKTQYHWGLTEYKKTADGCEFFGSDYAALSDAYTDDYDSDKCKDLESLWGKDFCKNCEKTGKSIVSLLSIAFISAAIGVLMIFMRMSGGGWVRTAVTALALMSSMVLLLIWNPAKILSITFLIYLANSQRSSQQNSPLRCTLGLQ